MERFMELWTAKEAYVKALGTGLAIDPLRLECWRKGWLDEDCNERHCLSLKLDGKDQDVCHQLSGFAISSSQWDSSFASALRRIEWPMMSTNPGYLMWVGGLPQLHWLGANSTYWR